MEAAIDVEDLAGGVVEEAVGDGADGFGDVGGFAHAALGEKAVGDFFLVGGFDGGDHICTDDAGANFEDLDVRGRQAGGFGVRLSAPLPAELLAGFQRLLQERKPLVWTV